MPPVTEAPVATVQGEEPGAQLGAALAGAGDLDGDGYADLAIGAPYTGDRAGAVILVRGGALAEQPAAWITLAAPAGDEHFGFSLASAGDMDGDGYSDLAVGAPATLDDSGRVRVYTGGPAGPSPEPTATLDAPEPGAVFGFSLSGGGDLDGDAADDLWVGAFRLGVGVGAAIRYAGVPDGGVAVRADAVYGQDADGNFGQAVSGGGDLDGDGTPDLAVGAPRARAEAGEVSWFAGAPVLAASPDGRVVGDARDAQLGTAISTAGDVDGDGLDDLLAGAPGGSAFFGTATLYAGGSDDPRELGTWTGPRDGSHLGYAVAIAGDLDGDGLHDLALGVGDATPEEGAAWVVRGARAGLAEGAAQVLDGPGGETHFGGAIAGAGDVDGDGCDDLLVGAGNADDFAGRAYLYAGVQAEDVTEPDTGDLGDSAPPDTGAGAADDTARGAGDSGAPGRGAEDEATAAGPCGCGAPPGAVGFVAWALAAAAARARTPEAPARRTFTPTAT